MAKIATNSYTKRVLHGTTFSGSHKKHVNKHSSNKVYKGQGR